MVSGLAKGSRTTSPSPTPFSRTPREIVVLNSGAALYAANIAASIADGIQLARETIASGAARRKLDQFVATTKKLGG